MYFKKRLSISMLAMASCSAFAFNPTPAQLKQFQSLPKAQQEQLARQYGVDVSALTGGGQTAVKETAPKPMVPSTTKTSVETPQSAAKHAGNELKAFGYDVLKGKPLDMLSTADTVPVPLDYEMAAGDEINVQLYGKTNRQVTLKINREGVISFPEFGPLHVAGQTFAQVRKHIIDMVKQKAIGVDVAVSMGAMRTMQIFIAGEATQPGAYNVNGLTTITQALISSGGVKQTGSLRHIQLKRKGKVISTLDLYSLLTKGDTSQDIRLLAGDTLFVPMKENSVAVTGAVGRPAIYELKGKTSLHRLLELSGKTKPQAYLSKVNIKRTTPEGVKVITVDANTYQGRHFIVKNGDKINVASSSQLLQGAVALRGEVVRQGAINFKTGMRISDVIHSAKEDLKRNADLSYALVVREIDQNHNIEVLQFNLLNALNNKNAKDNLKLKERDQIFIFDNGIEVNYWYNQTTNEKVNTNKVTVEKESVTNIDQATGAEVETEQKLNVQDNDSIAKGEGVQQSSREKLLNPIIDRLKAQATFKHPASLVEVTGAVRFPGVYPLAKNAKMKEVVQAAGGLSEKAFLDEAELTRRNLGSEKFNVTHTEFSLKDELKDTSKFTINAQDHIVIKTKPNWQKDMIIDLQGEVKFPGKYTFQRGETLKDIIERAGGFTQYADPNGAIFSRKRLQRQEQERLALLNMQLKKEVASLALRRQTASATYPTSPKDALEVSDALSKAKAVGRLVINVPEAMTGDENANIMLEKGDKLFIPAKNPTISVMGEVQYTSNHTFKPGMSIEDYIDSAGGTKKQADTDRIYVVHADGSVGLPNNSFWFSRKSTQLSPGDTIIVPIDTDYLDGLSTLTSATQILYQIGVAWSAIK